MIPVRYFMTFLLFFPLALYAQEEKKDTVIQERKTLGTEVENLTDDIAKAVRHTGRRIRRKVKDFNAIDTVYISPNLYNLFAAEQMQLGGPYTLRGYQPAEIIGDYGVSGTLEYRTPIPFLDRMWPWLDERLRLAFFYDFGYVKEHKNLYDFPTNFLNSLGFGLHASVTQFLSAQSPWTLSLSFCPW